MRSHMMYVRKRYFLSGSRITAFLILPALFVLAFHFSSDLLWDSPLVSDQLFWYVFAKQVGFFEYVATPDFVYYPIIEKTIFWVLTRVIEEPLFAARSVAYVGLYLKGLLVCCFMLPEFDRVITSRIIRLGVCGGAFFIGNIDNFFIQNIPYFHVLFFSYFIILVLSDPQPTSIGFFNILIFFLLIFCKVDLAVLVPIALLFSLLQARVRGIFLPGCVIALSYFYLIYRTSQKTMRPGYIREDFSLLHAAFDAVDYAEVVSRDFLLNDVFFKTNTPSFAPMALFFIFGLILVYRQNDKSIKVFLALSLMYFGQAWFSAFARATQTKHFLAQQMSAIPESSAGLIDYHHGHIMAFLYLILLLGVVGNSLTQSVSENRAIIRRVCNIFVGSLIFLLSASHTNIGAAQSRLSGFSNLDTHPRALESQSDMCLITPWVYWREYVPAMNGICASVGKSMPLRLGRDVITVPENEFNEYVLDLERFGDSHDDFGLVIFVAPDSDGCGNFKMLAQKNGLKEEISRTRACSELPRIIYFNLEGAADSLSAADAVLVKLPSGFSLIEGKAGGAAFIAFERNFDVAAECQDGRWNLHCYLNAQKKAVSGASAPAVLQ